MMYDGYDGDYDDDDGADGADDDADNDADAHVADDEDGGGGGGDGCWVETSADPDMMKWQQRQRRPHRTSGPQRPA